MLHVDGKEKVYGVPFGIEEEGLKKMICSVSLKFAA
jgi:hypothetical protein